MSRPPERRSPHGQGAGFEETQSGGLQADSKLVSLLIDILSLPAGVRHIRMVEGVPVMTPDMYLYSMAVRHRCHELGGDSDAHIDRAYEAIAGRATQ